MKATVELRLPGNLDGRRIGAQMNPKEMEQVFTDAAIAARATDPAAFLSSLDAAIQAAALRPGMRIVVAVLNSPPLSSDMEHTVKNLVGLCRTSGVRVVVLDIVEPGQKSAPSALEILPKNTGGAWVHQAGELEASLLSVTQTALAEGTTPAAAASRLTRWLLSA